ncbi:hypothetical protein [Vibrio crassostreae]|uniref:hypothetical protein n=1 Tax=Vibrio crassostreae TaxID=246167 RepID=UPI001B30D845|nr:hypothetical protein [Vibrio crassostreae]
MDKKEIMFTIFHQYKYLNQVFDNFDKTLDIQKALTETKSLNPKVTEHLLSEYQKGKMLHEAMSEHFEEKYCYLVQAHGRNFFQIRKIMRAELFIGLGRTFTLTGLILAHVGMVMGFKGDNTPLFIASALGASFTGWSSFIFKRSSTL